MSYYSNNKQYYQDYQREYLKHPKNQYRRLIYKAKQKSIPVSLTQQEFLEMYNNECFYCGQIVNGGYGIDRLDHQLGYSKENCVRCCFKCNSRKGGLELAGFKYPRTIELMEELLQSENI